jgi:N-acetylglutamate synthase-like GNAT family acetyltransferase
MHNPLVIEPFAGQYNAQIIQLISNIQQNEFNLPITPQDQPDLSQIPQFYQQAAGNFWLARLDNQVVGCVALVDIGNGQAALRKMFVQQEFRGSEYKIADRLLKKLLAWSEEQSLKEIYLGTTTAFTAAHRFYEKNGFSPVAREDLPKTFPIMGVDSIFYCMKLD